jgi:hypothetical protein
MVSALNSILHSLVVFNVCGSQGSVIFVEMDSMEFFCGNGFPHPSSGDIKTNFNKINEKLFSVIYVTH